MNLFTFFNGNLTSEPLTFVKRKSYNETEIDSNKNLITKLKAIFLQKSYKQTSCLFQTKILQQNWKLLKWKSYKETESCFFALVNGIYLIIVENDNTAAYTLENLHELLQFPVSWTTYGKLNWNWTTYGELNWNCRLFGIYTLFPL